MKIAWIFPQNKLCGISFYSQKYVQALRQFDSIECLDPLDYRNNRKAFLKAVQLCDICHIQYETSFFLLKNKDFFFKMCSEIKCPIIVTLHEVYKQFPDVFPRDEIKGNVFTKPIKEYIYDKRHPFATYFTRHVLKGFSADKIIVHARFQKNILIEKGLTAAAIDVLSIPVQSIDIKTDNKWKNGRVLNLAVTGFINPSYDYDLLFETLGLLEMPWEFTWIGGVRRPEDQGLLEAIQSDVVKRGWENRFIITGRVSDQKRDALLSDAHIYCAFFKHKSSSESLATAIGAHLVIIATKLPLTEEMTSEFPAMHLVDNDPKTVVVAINNISSDTRMRETLTNACEKYTLRYSYENMAKRMVSEYERLLSA
jgi:glycosyltransferase involved in cell wall biosynthesis